MTDDPQGSPPSDDVESESDRPEASRNSDPLPGGQPSEGSAPDGQPSDGSAPGGEPPDDDPAEPTLRLPLMLRLLLYYSSVLVVLHLGGAFLLTLWVPIDELAAGAEIDYRVLLAVQAGMILPVVMVTRWFLARVDAQPLASIGARLPGEPGRRVGWFLLAAGSALVGLGVWWLSALIVLDVQVDGWLGASSEIGTWWPGGFGRLLSVLTVAAGFVAIAALEEWIYRGYIYSRLRERYEWVHAAGLTTLFYLILLLGGAQIPAAGLFNILLLELVLAGLREASGSLWTGVAFHSAWNVCLGSVLSLPVSGQEMPRFFDVQIAGHELLSGGVFGPEGSLLMTLPLLLMLGFLVVRLQGSSSEPTPTTET